MKEAFWQPPEKRKILVNTSIVVNLLAIIHIM